jgi:hypothetical protein
MKFLLPRSFSLSVDFRLWFPAIFPVLLNGILLMMKVLAPNRAGDNFATFCFHISDSYCQAKGKMYTRNKMLAIMAIMGFSNMPF